MKRLISLSILGSGIMCIMILSCTNTSEEQKENNIASIQDTIVSSNEENNTREYVLPSAG